MAVFRSTFALADSQQNRNRPADSNPVLDGRSGVGLTELTTSASSQNVQSGGSDWQAPQNGYVVIRSTGDVWVKFQSAPTAAVGNAFFIAAATDRDFGVRENDKLAVIDDS